jgi:hypothetical protein
MLSDTILGLAIALIVVSSVAWVSQYRKIRDRMKLRKTARAERAAKVAH